MKEKILELRKQGLGYTKISQILGCSRSLVRHYSNHEEEKNRKRARQRINRAKSHPFTQKYSRFIYRHITKRKNRKSHDFCINKLIYKRIQKFTGGIKLSTFTVQDVIDKFGENPKCYLTGQDIDINDTKSYQFDHIIPSSRGGQNTIDNLGICVSQANKAKGDMTPDEFYNLCELIIKHKNTA